MIFMEDQNKSNEEDYLNAITKDKKVAKDKKNDDVSKSELKKKDKEEKKKDKKEGKKHERGLIVAVVILAALFSVALPLAVIGVLVIVQSSNASLEIVDNSAASAENENGCETYECEEIQDMEKVLKEIRNKISQIGGEEASIRNIDGNIVYHKINGEGLLLPFKKAMGIEYTISEEDMGKFSDEAAKVLADMGYGEFAEVAGRKYFNDKGLDIFASKEKLGFAGVMCGFGPYQDKWVAACAGRYLWFDDDYNFLRTVVPKSSGNYLIKYSRSEALAIDLAEAYRKETDQTIGSVVLNIEEKRVTGGSIAYIRTDESKIDTADQGPVDGGYYFYKKETNSEWVYAGRAMGSYMGVRFYDDCGELSDETKEIFGSFYVCFDQKNNEAFYLDGSSFYIGQ